jgi:hypothetical protein
MYVTEVFSSDFSDSVDDIVDMTCRERRCVFFAKINRTIDRESFLEINKKIRLKLAEIGINKGFAGSENLFTVPRFSKSFSEYTQMLRIGIYGYTNSQY